MQLTRYMVSTLNTDQLRAQDYPLDEILSKAAEATLTLTLTLTLTPSLSP